LFLNGTDVLRREKTVFLPGKVGVDVRCSDPAEEMVPCKACADAG